MKEILDKTIGNFRLIGIQYTKNEINKFRKKAKQYIKGYKAMIDYKEDDEIYIGSTEDIIVGTLLATHLKQKLSMPLLDCSAIEEDGYGLPEFSIYYNKDARSWCGKWCYSNDTQSLDESSVFFALLRLDMPEYKEIQELLEYYFTEKNNIGIAILERRLIE